MGKHSAPPNRYIARAASVAAAGAAMTFATITPAHASTQSDLLKELIDCESGGSATVVSTLSNPSGPPSGLWQITSGTWAAYGGKQFAPTAARASVAEQNTVAIRISAGQGTDAWACAPAGLRAPFLAADVAAATGTSARAATPAPRAVKQVAKLPAVKPSVAQTPAARTAVDSDYQVVAGDALSMISDRAGLDWHKVYANNRDVIGSDPNLIFPGQRLDLRGAK